MYCPRCGSQMRELGSFNLSATESLNGSLLTSGPIKEYLCHNRDCGSEKARHLVLFNGVITNIYAFKKILHSIKG